MVELLAITAVIGTLLLLLFPGLSAASRYVNVTKCTSNLRLLSMEMHNYATDHDNLLPAAGSWNVELFGFVYTGVPKIADRQRIMTTMQSEFCCPSGYKAAVALNQNLSTPADAMIRVGYGMNATLPSSETNINPARNRRPSMILMQNPSSTMVLIDANLLWLGVAQIPVRLGQVRLRHDERLNTLFGDGHVEGIPYDKISTDPSATFWTGLEQSANP